MIQATVEVPTSSTQRLTSMSSDISIEKKTRKQEWEDNYNEVLEFAKKNGHLNLPYKNAETCRLANWLGRQKMRKVVSNYEREKMALLKNYGYTDHYNREAKKMKPGTSFSTSSWNTSGSMAIWSCQRKTRDIQSWLNGLHVSVKWKRQGSLSNRQKAATCGDWFCFQSK